MSSSLSKPRGQQTFEEKAARLEAKQAKVKALIERNRSEQREHATARVRRLGEAVLEAAGKGDARSAQLVEAVDAAIAKENDDSQSRKAARKP